MPQSNKTNGTFVAAASSVASGKWQKRRRRRPARCCPIDRPASLAPSLLWGLNTSNRGWLCGKWQCDELPKQQRQQRPHLWLPLMMMMTRKTKMLPLLAATAADGVDCAPVKCKLHISQKTKKSSKKKKMLKKRLKTAKKNLRKQPQNTHTHTHTLGYRLH